MSCSARLGSVNTSSRIARISGGTRSEGESALAIVELASGPAPASAATVLGFGLGARGDALLPARGETSAIASSLLGAFAFAGRAGDELFGVPTRYEPAAAAITTAAS